LRKVIKNNNFLFVWLGIRICGKAGLERGVPDTWSRILFFLNAGVEPIGYSGIREFLSRQTEIE
jgi:hypothetical protein